MHARARLALSLASLALASLAVTGLSARDNGQFDHIAPEIRAWFRSVIAPNGVPCCDESDGRRTDYDMRDGAYWVPIDGEWMRVPERAIVRDAGNPLNAGVVWYVRHRGRIIISCFVPGPET